MFQRRSLLGKVTKRMRIHNSSRILRPIGTNPLKGRLHLLRILIQLSLGLLHKLAVDIVPGIRGCREFLVVILGDVTFDEFDP